MGGKNLGGVKNFGPLKSLGFRQLSYLEYFGLHGGKNSPDYLEKKYGNTG